MTLAKQLSKQTDRTIVGKDLTEKEIKAFSENQIEHIYELFSITQVVKVNGDNKQLTKNEESLNTWPWFVAT